MSAEEAAAVVQVFTMTSSHDPDLRKMRPALPRKGEGLTNRPMEDSIGIRRGPLSRHVTFIFCIPCQ